MYVKAADVTESGRCWTKAADVRVKVADVRTKAADVWVKAADVGLKQPMFLQKAADVYISNVHSHESYQEVESGRCPLSTKAADVYISKYMAYESYQKLESGRCPVSKKVADVLFANPTSSSPTLIPDPNPWP